MTFNLNKINYGSSLKANIKMVDSIKKLASLRGVRMYIITNEVLGEFLNRPENVKTLEEFDRIRLENF